MFSYKTETSLFVLSLLEIFENSYMKSSILINFFSSNKYSYAMNLNSFVFIV